MAVPSLRAEIGSDCYSAMHCHALSTDREEVMGLLLGVIEGPKVKVLMSMALIRSDKRKDRVEIPPEVMGQVSTKVERRAEEIGLAGKLQVVGWYHSHPHITSLPSHVDLGTQANYQMLDRSFIGLIFSVFNESKANVAVDELCCFQSRRDDSGLRRQVVPFDVFPTALLLKEEGVDSLVTAQALGAVPAFLDLYIHEEKGAFDKADGIGDGSGDGQIGPKTDRSFFRFVHNAAHFSLAVGGIAETLYVSYASGLRRRRATAENRIEALQGYLRQLRERVENRPVAGHS